MELHSQNVLAAAGRGGWQRWISCGFVSCSLADHAVGMGGHLRMAKHIPSRLVARSGALVTLPLPSRDVHEGAVTLSQPSFVLGVTVMATNPTLPSEGSFRGILDLGSFQGCADTSGGEGGHPKAPHTQQQDK